MKSKKLINHTNTYLVVEDMLKSDIISQDTREKVEKIKARLDAEANDLMNESSKPEEEVHSTDDPEGSKAAD